MRYKSTLISSPIDPGQLVLPLSLPHRSFSSNPTSLSMQFSHKFSSLALFVLALAGVGMATPLAAPESATYLVSHDEMLNWIKTTDAELTIVGAPINLLAPRSAQNTMVTYCNKRINNVCGGSCTVYNGGAACLDAPGTTCLAATHNVGFCDRGGCGH
ncbi:hypothetical protein V8D89_010217, partial [Ganoderma adspersum]